MRYCIRQTQWEADDNQRSDNGLLILIKVEIELKFFFQELFSVKTGSLKVKT